MHPWILFLLAAAFSLCGWLVWRRIAPYWRMYREFARNAATCGYLPAPPKPRAIRLLRVVARCITGYQVGRIKVVGGQNLPTSGAAIVALNHPHYTDGFVVCQALPRPGRYMGARWVFRLPFGIGPLMARFGGFCVDTDKGKGGPAREAAITLLATGQQLVICPEGQTTLDGTMMPFKKGVISISRQAAERLGKVVPIIPVHLQYGRYPGSWINRWGHAGYLFLLLFAWYYRRGVTIVVGEPVNPMDLAVDDTEAAEQLRQRVAKLAPAKASDKS